MIAPLPGAVLAARLLPLVDHPDPEVVVAATRAAVAAGAPTVEVGLRHADSIEALRRASAAVAVPVGAGTVVDPAQAAAARDAGAAYLVSPGSSPALADAVTATGLPWLPGAATPTEVLALRAAGAVMVKVFPAATLGGPAHLRALASVAAGVRFVPTGGITEADVADYLAVGAVVAVGGSWMFPRHATADTDWTGVEAAVRTALARTRPT